MSDFLEAALDVALEALEDLPWRVLFWLILIALVIWLATVVWRHLA